MKKQKLIVILGQTATGKSDLAVKLARKFGGEVISADSRQVYKGLDIGTGKITKKEMWGTRHHLLDVASPKSQFTVAHFKKLSEEAMLGIWKRGKIPIVVGDSGFYIDTLLGKSFPEVPPNKTLRNRLEKKSATVLFAMLKKIDPIRAKTIDRHNPRRLMRAIEVAKTLGKNPIREQKQLPLEVLKIGVQLPKEILKEKINIRIQDWFRKGLIAEIKRLHTKGISWKRMGKIGLEYRIMTDFLQKKLTRTEAIKKMKIETWHYAKRQKVWFKRDKDILWFNPKEIEKIKKITHAFLKEK